MATHLTETVKFRLDAETLRAVEQLAQEGDRTIAAEMRRAVRAYIAQTRLEAEEEAVA